MRNAPLKRLRMQVNVFILLLAILLPGCCTHYTNLSQYKQDLKSYYATRYYPEIDKKVANGENYLKNRYAHTGEKNALVLDIDETSLSNWQNLATNMDFGFNPGEFDDWAAQEKAIAIPPVLRLFNEAKAAHIAVFFITGRKERLRAATEANLKTAGYLDWDTLYMMPDGQKSSVEEFKTATRKKITDNGYSIILNVGDQWSDLNGGFAEKCVKLPNPFYFVK